MGLRELLILVLILAIVAVVLRGVHVALRNRRNQLRVALSRNIPEYDIEEIELSELPNGGARQVERSFERVMQQNSAYDEEKEGETEASVSRAPERPPVGQTRNRAVADIPVLTETAEFDGDEHNALDGQVFVDDHVADDDDDDDDDLDDELDEALNELRRETEEDGTQSIRNAGGDPAGDADWLEEAMGDTPGAVADTEPEPEHVAVDPEPEPELPRSGPVDASRSEPDPAPAVEADPPTTGDDFDILLEGYEEERAQRMEELESRQDTASRRFMQWAGARMGRAGGLLRNGPAHDFDGATGKAAHKAEKRTAREARSTAGTEQIRQNELDLFEEQAVDTGPVSEAGPDSPETAVGDAAGVAPDGRVANKNVDPDYSEVLVVNVMAAPDQLIHGDELLPVLLGAGLRFGEMNIFHRHAQGKNGPVLFSVANILNPGTFDLNEMHEFATRGLCFFLTLPNAIDNMQAFEHMLQTARQVCDTLDAELKDDNRSVMTAQTIEHYRERIRAFELQRLRQEAVRQ